MNEFEHRHQRKGSWLTLTIALAVLALIIVALEKNLATDDLRKRGEMLNAAIKQECKSLRAANAITWKQASHIDDAIFAKYIPVGTSFRDAESILRAAQFVLLPSPPRAPSPGLAGFEFHIYGSMTLEQQLLVSRTWATVDVVPEKPGDPQTAVKEVHGAIFIGYL